MKEKYSNDQNKSSTVFSEGITVRRENRIIEMASKRQTDVVLVLENVHDPHNIGAVLRTCDSVGVAEVFVVYTHSNLDQETLELGLQSKTSSGASKWVKTTLFHSVEECVLALREKNLTLLGTHLHHEANSIYDSNFDSPIAIVLGNEKDGLSQEMLDELDGNIFIPQVGMVKSLNISVACAVVLYELFRQRKRSGKYASNDANEDLKEYYLNSHRKPKEYYEKDKDSN